MGRGISGIQGYRNNPECPESTELSPVNVFIDIVLVK